MFNGTQVTLIISYDVDEESNKNTKVQHTRSALSKKVTTRMQ